MPDDTARARKRGLYIGRQQSDGMTPVHGLLDPLGLATLEAVTAKLAAPGMCNPNDESPCISGTPSHDQIAGDDRSAAQRNHDALTAMGGRSMLSSGELGQHNGLPAMIIVSTTLQNLTDAAGVGVTAGGSLLPMSDVIRLASHAHHSLVVFDKHTARPLYLGRSKRIATADQRIVLLSRDRGCTRPGCTVCGYDCQVHHITSWAAGGRPTSTRWCWPARATTDSLTTATVSGSAWMDPSNGSRLPRTMLVRPGRTCTTTRSGC